MKQTVSLPRIDVNNYKGSWRFSPPKVLKEGFFSIDENRNFVNGKRHVKYCDWIDSKLTLDHGFDLMKCINLKDARDHEEKYVPMRNREHAEQLHMLQYIELNKRGFEEMRPDFVTHRGILRILLLSPYDDLMSTSVEKRSWSFSAILKNGTVYLSYNENNNEKKRELDSRWLNAMAQGTAFEKILLKDKPSDKCELQSTMEFNSKQCRKSAPQNSKRIDKPNWSTNNKLNKWMEYKSQISKSESLDSLNSSEKSSEESSEESLSALSSSDSDDAPTFTPECRAILRTTVGQHSIMYSGDLDAVCMMKKPTRNGANQDLKMIELKTHGVKPVHRRISLKWWTQCVLGGVSNVFVGYREDSGILRSIENIPTTKLENQCLQGRDSHPEVGFKFLEMFLGMVKDVVKKEGVTFTFTYDPPENKNWGKSFDIQVSEEELDEYLFHNLV